MRNIDVHQHLDEKDVRDFLGREVQETILKGIFFTEQGIQYAEEKIQKLQKDIDYARKRMALETLVKSKGWDWHDISDVVRYDKDYMNFIGTEEEYETLLETLKKEAA